MSEGQGWWPGGGRRGEAAAASRAGDAADVPRAVTGRVRPRGARPGPAEPAPSSGVPYPGVPSSGVSYPGVPYPGVPSSGPRLVWVPNPSGHQPSAGDAPGGRDPRARLRRVRASRRRKIARALVLLLALLVTASIGSYVWAGTQLNRTVDLGKLPDRPPRGKGANYLIVGSDSRQGLTDRAKKDLHTGSADGGRTDSMILLHTGVHGTTMVSLPRDSWLTIPSWVRPETGEHFPAAKNKLNASYALGGPDLLVRTVEHNTGLHIDHYAEIGFSGFVGVVNSVGGVRMCLDRDIRDHNSGLSLTKGCHVLDGTKALAFVRQRHQEAQGDLGRTMNQQKFLSALAHKAAAPGVALDPFKAYPTVNAGLHTLVVDRDMTPWTLATLARAMRDAAAGAERRINVPVSSLGLSTPKGSAIQWNAAQAKRLFTELREDRAVDVR